MSAREFKSDRHTRLDGRWPSTRPVPMPRRQHERPLFRSESEFWPRDSADWTLCKYLGALDLALILFLVISVWRH
jgi:hypothetical protein